MFFVVPDFRAPQLLLQNNGISDNIEVSEVVKWIGKNVSEFAMFS